MKRILVIDDEPYITEIMIHFAQKLGYETDVSHSGETTIRKIRENDYWAVFCDLKMPGLNGLEVFEKIREIRSDLSQRFVLLTGAIPDSGTESVLSEMRIPLFRKPFNFQEFTNLLGSLEKQA
jgi:DNA-binding response OmpR family regulator